MLGREKSSAVTALKTALARTLLVGFGLFSASTSAAVAQVTDGTRLVILRASVDAQSQATLMREVDEALMRALVEDAGFGRARVSTTRLEDVELLAGCEGVAGDCLQRVAASLDDGWVLMREIGSDESGAALLTLMAQSGTDVRSTRRLEARMPRRDRPARDAIVRKLVRDLYAVPEKRPIPVLGRSEPETTADRVPRVLRALGWSGVAVGTGLLAAGVTLGVQSGRAHDRSEDLVIRTQEDADEFARLLERSQDRASMANGFFVAGSAFALSSVGVLLWNLLRAPSADVQGVHMAATPLRHGAALHVSGVFEGRH